MMVTGESTYPPLVTSAVREISAQRSPSLAHRLGTRLVPILILSGVIAWTAVQLMETTGGATYPAGGAPALVADDDADAPERIFAGRDVGGLLGLRVLALAGDVDVSTIEDFGVTAVQEGAVTVLNLWATWCGPCKEELPGLRRTLASAGDTVRFVPMLVDSTVTPEEARLVYNDLGGPQPAAFVADAGLGGGVRQQLVDLELLAGDADVDLPMTLILDCHRRLRWHHTGVLTEADFAELARVLSELHGEVGTATCEPERSKRKVKRRRKKPGSASLGGDPAEPETDVKGEVEVETDGIPVEGSDSERGRPDHRRRSVCDRNGLCEAQRGETEINCPSDCKTVM